MYLYDLIHTIAKEVLGQLNAESEQACVMVMGEKTTELAATIGEALKSTLGDKTNLIFYGEETDKLVPNRYIVPFLSCNDMAELATGKASKPIMAEVLKLILAGAELEIFEFEYKAYKESAPGPLYTLYEAYEKTLTTYGVKEFKRKQPDTIRFWEKLVTETTVNQAHKNGASVILVPITAIITPLALDAAKNLNINILKRL